MSSSKQTIASLPKPPVDFTVLKMKQYIQQVGKGPYLFSIKDIVPHKTQRDLDLVHVQKLIGSLLGGDERLRH